MKISNSAKYAVGVLAAVALLAGCTSSGGSQLAPTGSTGANAIHQMGGNHKVDLSQTLVVPRNVKPQFHKVPQMKQIKPNCCALQKTAFVTDAFGGSSFTGAVYAFDYVTGASLGTVPAPPEGFLEVQGACQDTHGNSFFANTGLSTIDEYTHSGTYVQTLSDPGQYPVGCSYDPSTGNLAVSNIINTSGGNGGLSIYTNASGSPTVYSIPGLAKVYFLAYEGKTGTLWLDGFATLSDTGFTYGNFVGGTFTPVTISGATIGFAGSVNYSGKLREMSVGDQDTFSSPTVYQVTDTGTVTGSTVTTCGQASGLCDPVQWGMKGPGVVLSDAIWLAAHRFNYPAGGAFTIDYSGPSYVQPIGASISPAKS